MYDYRQSYSQMSDDELLNVATQAATLIPEAQDALEAELRKRQLSQPDVVQYQEERAREDAARPIKPPVVTLQGTGAKVYGKRDFAADGSYLTTRWFVLSLIPLVPLATFRVRRVRRWSPLENWNDSHEILMRSKPMLKQVLFVYAYLLGLAGTLYLLRFDWMRALIACCLLLPVPFILRRYARANMALAESAPNEQMTQPPAIT